MTAQNPGLYAIIDVIAQSIVQNIITISRHEAPMVRMFTDLLSGKGPIADHPADYQLVRLGYIDDNHQLQLLLDQEGDELRPQIILAGERWAKLHQQAADNGAQQARALATREVDAIAR